MFLRYAALPPAVQWGIEHESHAKRDYMMIKSAVGDVKLEDTGLTLCSTHSFLGASSDGRVKENEEEGIIEIKCPFSLKNRLINSMEIESIIELNDSSFCLENGPSGPQLKKEHAYYTQVQGEMAILGVPWCDFVVWTSAKTNNIFIERVKFDSDFVMIMLQKLVQFYVENVVPKLYSL